MDSSETSPATAAELRLDGLRVIKLLGKGATGTVLLVREDSSDQSFAVKVVEKLSVHHHRHADHRARHEISVLGRLSAAGEHHPFLPRLIGSAEDRELICWGIPYCSGGDLNVLRYRQNDHVFSPAVIRFYLAEIVCALEHLHHRGIVYRDLKPENILVQQSGHVTLTDFDLSCDLGPRTPVTGNPTFFSDDEKPDKHRKFTRFIISRKWGKHDFATGVKKAKSARVSPVSRRSPSDCSTNQRSNSFVGTEEYVAPEVIRGDGHEFAVDWWALGILCYEMLYGFTPFKGKNRKETFGRILLTEPEFMGKPNSLTDLIGKLLEKDPTRRLGYGGGSSEIKAHEFFRGLGWDLLTEVLRPPFLPLQEVTEGGTDRVTEYLQKLKGPPTPLCSPSLDEHEDNVSLTEF